MGIRALVVEIGEGIQRTSPDPVDFTALGQDEACLLRTNAFFYRLLVECNSKRIEVFESLAPCIAIRMDASATLFD